MSPKLRDERCVQIIPERVKEMATKRNVKMKDLAEAVGTVYENFSRQIKKGIIQKDWLEILCDKLSISRKYLTGECDRRGSRSNDFNVIEKQREAFKMLFTFSNHKGLCTDIDNMNDFEISELATFTAGLILDWDDIQEELAKADAESK